MKQNLLFNRASAFGMRFIMVLTMLLVVGIGQAWGESVEINTDNSGVNGSYRDYEFDVNSITFGCTQWMKNNNIQAKKSITNSLYNVDAIPGKITSIVVKQTGTARAIKIYGGTSSKPTTQITSPSTAAEMTFDFTGKDYTYFSLTTPGNACYFDKITINYADATPKQKYTLSYQAGETNGALQVEEGANLLDALGELETPTSCDATSTTFVGWTATEITEKTNTAPILITSSDVMPSSEYAVHAVFAREETTEGGMTTTTFTAGTDDIATGKNGIKFTMSNTTGSGGYYQVYSGSAMTINSDNPITSFIITCTASGTTKYGPGNITFKTGSYSYSGTNGTWTGDSKTIESNNSSAQLRITKIVVTTSGGTTTTYSDYITSCITKTTVSLIPKITIF